MERNRFVSVLLAVSPQSVKLLKNGAKGIVPATDATAPEKAAIQRWIGFKTGQPAGSKKASKPTRKAAKAAKKAHLSKGGVAYPAVPQNGQIPAGFKAVVVYMPI